MANPPWPYEHQCSKAWHAMSFKTVPGVELEDYTAEELMQRIESLSDVSFTLEGFFDGGHTLLTVTREDAIASAMNHLDAAVSPDTAPDRGMVLASAARGWIQLAKLLDKPESTVRIEFSDPEPHHNTD